MKTIEINLYSYNELSEDAKDKIRDKWRYDGYGVMDGYNDDWEGTLDKFCDLCNIKAKNCEVDNWHHYFSIDYGCNSVYEVQLDEDTWDNIYIEDLSGKLLFRYISNNIIPYLIKGKYHSVGHTDENGKFTYKSRRSRVVKTFDDCPLTGVVCDIIEPLMKYYRNWAKYPDDYTYADLMNECLESFFKAWSAEWEYRLSDEAVDEDIEANWDDEMFLESGERYRA